MNCIYSLPCYCSDSNDILNKFSFLLRTWFQNPYINPKDSKLHFKIVFLNIYIRITCEFLHFYSHLGLETIFAALKLTQICWININIFFCNLITNWLPLSYTHTKLERLPPQSDKI